MTELNESEISQPKNYMIITDFSIDKPFPTFLKVTWVQGQTGGCQVLRTAMAVEGNNPLERSSATNSSKNGQWEVGERGTPKCTFTTAPWCLEGKCLLEKDVDGE